uniref:Dynein light chain n=1 Tax=Steinernema glaseri TaxID=37863 RepID=A0A1I7XW76_9BILA
MDLAFSKALNYQKQCTHGRTWKAVVAHGEDFALQDPLGEANTCYSISLARHVPHPCRMSAVSDVMTATLRISSSLSRPRSLSGHARSGN